MKSTGHILLNPIAVAREIGKPVDSFPLWKGQGEGEQSNSHGRGCALAHRVQKICPGPLLLPKSFETRPLTNSSTVVCVHSWPRPPRYGASILAFPLTVIHSQPPKLFESNQSPAFVLLTPALFHSLCRRDSEEK